ncbi:omega-amidase nit2 [Anaeramoeba ignava]|uniref:Omega-amidase nit2 n=1 Tax=Anaeramoeba ignava TaxID=1746090 RepID=A0A9Q0R8Z5_ANAIG|nr:omega-amidase nit2 [Anaeramoeba ignava]|eukprot:Anaeramoba_ignava/a479202_112.p2 GENE.a479202_112~~a479202_112.p2  ORF type:complete len:293 (+),score=81.25 a479202_112:1177-2055(+)
MDQNKKLTVGIIQSKVTQNKQENIETMKKTMGEFIEKYPKTELLVLGECWGTPYNTKKFKQYSENIEKQKSPSVKMLSEFAKNHEIYIIGGTIIEKVKEENETKLYNTCCVFDSKGELIGKYRKIHLFNIDIPNKITFKESETLSAGKKTFAFSMKNGNFKIGIGICFDMRFPELTALYSHIHNINLMVYPGAFNMTTGVHWGLYGKVRALDTQSYVILASPARDENSPDYVAWGHSSIFDPFASIVSELDHNPGFISYTLDLDVILQTRQQIPVLKGKRFDFYDVSELKKD